MAVLENSVASLGRLCKVYILLLKDLKNIDFVLIFHSLLLIICCKVTLIIFIILILLLRLHRRFFLSFGSIVEILRWRVLLLLTRVGTLMRWKLVNDHIVILIYPVVLSWLLLHLLGGLVLLSQDFQDVHDV